MRQASIAPNLLTGLIFYSISALLSPVFAASAPNNEVTVSVSNHFVVADKFYLASCFADANTGAACDSALNTDSEGTITETYPNGPKQIVFRVFAPLIVLKPSDFAVNCPQIKYWRLSSKYFIWSTDVIKTTSNHLSFRISIDTNSQVTCTLSQ